VTVLTVFHRMTGQETSFAQDGGGRIGDLTSSLHGDTAWCMVGTLCRGASGGTVQRTSLDKGAKARTLPAIRMEAPPECLDFAEGKVFLKSDPAKAIAFQQVVEAAYGFKACVPNIEPGLEATSFYEPSNCLFPFGAHVAVVEVDPETGDIKFRRYIAVDDCGNIINPMLVKAKCMGASRAGLPKHCMKKLSMMKTVNCSPAY
jgi:carbon-monoxide dehydrogenase large subunit